MNLLIKLLNLKVKGMEDAVKGFDDSDFFPENFQYSWYPATYMAASLGCLPSSPHLLPCLVPACVLSLHTSLPSLFLPSGLGFQYLCLINSPSILKYHLKTYVPPTTTPFNFLSAFIYFILWLPLALRNSSDSLQKTALQRAVTAFDMKDCNRSDLKYLVWVVSTCASILSPWNDGNSKKESEQGEEGISNRTITWKAAPHFQVRGTVLLYPTRPVRTPTGGRSLTFWKKAAQTSLSTYNSVSSCLIHL